MRPRRLSEIVGQEKLLSANSVLSKAIADDRVPSMILWGPPGTGKTTIARALASESRAELVPFSAVLAGVPELRKVIEAALDRRRTRAQRTILFVDEIHRWNKAQQDALLPHVENGTIVLVGATTENPSFAINAALLSRARVFRLEAHTAGSIATILRRALEDETQGLGKLGIEADDDALDALAEAVQGDGRRALDVLELAAETVASDTVGARRLTREAIEGALAQKTLLYDKSGEEHYNLASAFIKSLRGSDPDAALYYGLRMIEAGEDPRFVLRRMIIFASEDVGLADSRALELTVAADRAFERLGVPEGLIPLSHAVIYLALAPKSKSAYNALGAAREEIARTGALPVPLRLRNAPTKAMKAWGYGREYRDPQKEEGGFVAERYLPEALGEREFYAPTTRGTEGKIAEHLTRLRERARGGR